MLVWLNGGFALYINSTRFIFEVFQQQAASFSVSFPRVEGTWKSIGVSWNKRYYRQLEVYVNGERVSTAPEEWKFSGTDTTAFAAGTLHIGGIADHSFAFRTVMGLLVRDLVIWNRYLYSFEVHRFLGVSGLLLSLHF